MTHSHQHPTSSQGLPTSAGSSRAGSPLSAAPTTASTLNNQSSKYSNFASSKEALDQQSNNVNNNNTSNSSSLIRASTKESIASVSENFHSPQHQDLNISKEGWLNKLNSSTSALSSFSSSAYSSSPSASSPWSSANQNNWRLTRAVLKDGVLTISKPPSDLAVKSFDSSVPSQPPSNYANSHPEYYPSSSNNSILSSNTLTNTNTTSSSSSHLKRIVSSTHSTLLPGKSNRSGSHSFNGSSKSHHQQQQHNNSNHYQNQQHPIHQLGTPTATRLFFKGNEPHIDLEYDRGKIVGGTDEAICHTILFGPSESFAKTSVLLLPLLTDIVSAIDMFTLYSTSVSHLASSLPPSQQPRSGSVSSTVTNNNNNNNGSPPPGSPSHASIVNDTSSTLNGKSLTSPSQSSLSSTQTNSPPNIVSRLKLVIETIQDNFPGMLLDNTIFSVFMRLVESVSYHDDTVATDLKMSVFMKQKSMTEILSYASHQEPIMWSGVQVNISETVTERLHFILNRYEHSNSSHDPSNVTQYNNLPTSGSTSNISLPPPPQSNHHSASQSSKFITSITPDLILDLDVDIFANQIYHFHLAFSKDWSPTSDISLLFSTKYNYNRHSPLVFDSTNIHFLGDLLIDHLFNISNRVDNSYRGKILTYWINLGNALKNCGDMVGWLAIATVICSIPVLRLRGSWCYVSSEIRDRVTKEWAPVVFDLERRLMISDMSRKSTFHVLAPQGIGITYPKERVVPFFGDLCVKYEEGSTYKQCESRLNRIRTAFERWDYYLENIPQNDTFEPLPDAVPLIQRLLYALLAHHFEAPIMPLESILKLSLAIEPNYFGQYLKFHYSQKPALTTGSHFPLIFNSVVPSFNLLSKNSLLAATAPQQNSTKRTLRPSSSRTGDFRSGSIRHQSISGTSTSSLSSSPINSISSPTLNSPGTHSSFPTITNYIPLTTGYAEIDNPNRQYMASVIDRHPFVKDVRDVLNVNAKIFHIFDDIVIKTFDDFPKINSTTIDNPLSDDPSVLGSTQTIATGNNGGSRPGSIVLVEGNAAKKSSGSGSRRVSSQFASAPSNLNSPVLPDLFDAQTAEPIEATSVSIETVVKAANLERLVDILVISVGDFSSFVNKDDLTKYLDNAIKHSPNQISSAILKSTPPTFVIDMDIHTMTFFATYRSFCSPSVLLESFRKRFVGAQSAALSISAATSKSDDTGSVHNAPMVPNANDVKINVSHSTSHNDVHFPNWDPTCNADPETIDWRIVAQIQIGVLEACYLWVSQYFSDFANDLVARDQFLDLLRNFEVELQTWKDAGVLLRDDYKYYYDTIEALHKKVRKLFIKKSYRPIDIKKLLPIFPVGIHYENLPHNGDIQTLESLIDDIDCIAAEYFSMVSLRDWMEVFETLETQGADVTGFFRYRPPHSSNEDEIIVQDIYVYMETLFKASPDERTILNFPRPIRELFRLHTNLVYYFTSQISDSTIKRDERVGRMTSILKILGICKQKMAGADIFASESNNNVLNFYSMSEESRTTENLTPIISDSGNSIHYGSNSTTTISPHIPSFIETAVAAAVARPESRGFANSWLQASKEISKQFGGPFSGSANSIESIVPDIPISLLKRSINEYDGTYEGLKPLTPCVGWLVERMLEAVCYIPNMCIENPKLINFDKRRYIYNLVVNIMNMKTGLTTLDARFNGASMDTPSLLEFSKRISYLVNPVKGLYHLDRRVARDAASRELKEYPRASSKNKVFTVYVASEVEKLKRDQRQRDTVERQAKEQKKANTKMSKMSGESSGSSLVDRKISKSRFGGLLKAVRPISMAFSGSFTPPVEKTIHPDDLPELGFMGDARFKQVGHLKLIDCDISHVKSARDKTLFKVSYKGADHWFQALSESDAEDWVRSLDLARKHANLLAVMSPTSAKVFGVPVRVVCEREGTMVPRVVETLLNEIEERGLTEVGIYRIPGSLASVNALKAAFDSGEDVNMQDDRWFDVNTVTGCFKLYLRELPEPLLTYELMDSFVSCGAYGNTPEGISRLRSCVVKLPPANYNLLKRLVEHLFKVTEHGDENKMHAVNLAIVFSMSLLPSSSSTAMMNSELGSMQTILKTMILSHDKIFGDYVEDQGNYEAEAPIATIDTLSSADLEDENDVTVTNTNNNNSSSNSSAHPPVHDSLSFTKSSLVQSEENAQTPSTAPQIPTNIIQTSNDDTKFFDHESSSFINNEAGETIQHSSNTGSHQEASDNSNYEVTSGSNNNTITENSEVEKLEDAMSRSMLTIPARAASRLQAEGRNKRFSSLILSSDFSAPGSPSDRPEAIESNNDISMIQESPGKEEYNDQSTTTTDTSKKSNRDSYTEVSAY